jgi:2'-5' RNA ligase
MMSNQTKRSLLVVNYPTLQIEDWETIQITRKNNDRLYYDVVAPHFTLVFPTFTVDEATFVNHVKQVAQATHAFDFVIRCATLGDDAFSDYTHVFLVPDEGYSQIIRFHDRLYTGILTPELRLDIPFVPHIGIANDLDPKVCKMIVDRWNSRDFTIRGRVEQVDIIWYEDNQVDTITKIPLKIN